MVAQQGTLNFSGDDIYMVLSLPASAFGKLDEDSDGRLSMEEFAKYRADIVSAVQGFVSLSDKTGAVPLQGMMVSPVTPHDDPKAPADQVIVMGRYSLENTVGELSFRVTAYGIQPETQSLKITAIRKSTTQKQVFSLSPGSPEVVIEFR